MNFKANKYDANNDPHLPIVGRIIEGAGTIMEVEPIEAGVLLEMMQSNEPADLRGHSDLLVSGNPERPFLKYLVWVKK